MKTYRQAGQSSRQIREVLTPMVEKTTAGNTSQAKNDDKSKAKDAEVKAEDTKAEEVPTTPEKADEQVEPDEEYVAYTDEVENATGTVSEVDNNGDEFDVPYVYLTADDFPRPRTSDSDDPGRSWTAQEVSEKRTDGDGKDSVPAAIADVVATPGQTFRVRELPDRKVLEAAGINYEQFVAGLPVRPDVPHEGARKGIPA